MRLGRVCTVEAQHAAPDWNVMKQHPVRPQRRSIRLKNYNYSQGGSYFVTVCINGHRCILGSINNGVPQFTSFGEIVQEFWLAIPLHFPNVTLNESVVMPNHFHGILTLANGFAGAACCAPTENLNTNSLQRTAKPLSLAFATRC